MVFLFSCDLTEFKEEEQLLISRILNCTQPKRIISFNFNSYELLSNDFIIIQGPWLKLY